MKIPTIGTREGTHLEFKAADAMRTKQGRRKIAKEAVAMLNASGGKIWVGIHEENDCMRGLDPFDEKDEHFETSLRDTLLDLIEPRPSDLDLERIDVPGGWVVVLKVQGGKRGVLYCLKEGDSRLFIERFDDRIRGMEFHEIQKRMSNASPVTEDNFHADSLKRALSSKNDYIYTDGYLLFVSIGDQKPERKFLPEDLDKQFSILKQTSFRPHGWVFPMQTAFGDGEASWKKPGMQLTSGIPSSAYRLMFISNEGWACFSMGLDNLQWGVPNDFPNTHPGAKGLINPLPFLEYTTSAIHLLPHIWPDYANSSNTKLQFTFMLNGIRGWFLPPYAQEKLGYHHPLNPWKQFLDAKDLGIQKSAWASSLNSNPDSIAYELIEDVYREFGHNPKVIPYFKGDPPVFSPPS
jgi:hypothetical protein